MGYITYILHLTFMGVPGIANVFAAYHTTLAYKDIPWQSSLIQQ